MSLKSSYAIAGIGETAVGRFPEVTTNGLALEAISKALSDAGIRPTDVDGLIADQPGNLPHRSYALALAHWAGIMPNYATDLGLGGAGPAASVAHAAMAIDAGLCHTVVCVHAEKQATGRSEPYASRLLNGLESYEEPFGAIGGIPLHAAAAARHMHEFGTTAEQMAAVAVACRRHASLNAAATKRDPITVEDVLQSRWIVTPFHLLDCSLVSDGAGAVVVTSADRAVSMRRPAVYLWGFGMGHAGSVLEAPALTSLGGRRSAATAFEMAGIAASDVDFAQLYDCFTAVVIITLEDYGFCSRGEGGAFVEGGRIELGGELPVNTHGGLLSQGHVEGMLHVTEAVKQLRGSEVEPERQIAHAEVGVVSGHGAALGAHATLVLGRSAPGG